MIFGGITPNPYDVLDDIPHYMAYVRLGNSHNLLPLVNVMKEITTHEVQECNHRDFKIHYKWGKF